MAQKKPNWLPKTAYATPRGWAIKHPSGLEEVLYSARGLVSETVPEPVVEAPVVVPEPVDVDTIEAPFSVYPPEETVVVEEAPKPAPAKIKLFKDKK